jgi:hypothetical protein
MKTHYKTIKPEHRMWRTLVRVHNRFSEGVMLIISGWNIDAPVWCPRKAIPPVIFQTMKTDKRYHVKCNIGAEEASNICFDSWEKE